MNKTKRPIVKVWYYIVMDAFNRRITECSDYADAMRIAAFNGGYVVINRQYR